MTAIISTILIGVPLSNIQAIELNEAPSLQREVALKKLEVVDHRVPEAPMIIQPVYHIGKYGGKWRMGMRRGRDHALLIRTMGYEHLVRWNEEWTGVIPNVAQSYEILNGGREFRFQLRKGMRWSDGDLFDTEDIRFWYEDIASNEELMQDYDLWRFAGGRKPKLQVIDSYAFSLKFEQPHGLFMDFLASPEGAEPNSYPSHYLKELLPKYNPQADAQAKAEGFKDWKEKFVNVFGTPGTIDHKSRWSNPNLPTLNAWVLKGKFGRDEPIIAERNPYYWKVDTAGNQLPYIDQLEFSIVDKKSEIRAAAKEGNIDMQLRAMTSFSHKVVSDPQKWPEIKTFGAIDTDMNKSIIAFNLNHEDPTFREIFNSRDFRIAMSLGIDRATIIRSMGENIGVPYQAAPRPESPFYNEKMATQYTSYLPTQANKMLDALGLERGEDGIRRHQNGKKISFFIDTVGDDRFEILKMVSQQWLKLGIDVTPRNLTRNAFYDEREINAHDASSWGGDGGIAVIQAPIFYFPFYHESLHAVQWARWFLNQADPKAIEPPKIVKRQMQLYREIIKSADQHERETLMKEILEIAAEEFYVMGISLPPIRYGIYKQGFENVPPLMPAAWTYPTPAPTNPAQYFFSK